MKRFLMGNEAIALGALLEGATAAYSYPGTPASEILPAFMEFGPDRYAQWSLNEKIALELSVAEAVAGRSVLCAMKQVGLNVAADPLFSSAYTGVDGALVIVSADDPGPYSSQTEQDSRSYAVASKIPVFDPSTPADALRLTGAAFDLSRRFHTPVMLRPVMRVCHGRQDTEFPDPPPPSAAASFRRDPDRWAATPRHRSVLHRELIARLDEIAKNVRPAAVNPRHSRLVTGSGYPMALLADLVDEYGLQVDVIKIDMPFPLSADFIREVESSYSEILILEETFPVIENQFNRGDMIRGKKDGTVPVNGEMTLDTVRAVLERFLGGNLPVPRYTAVEAPPPSIPRLCAGCGHRSAFFAIKRAFPRGLYPGDIGCYTLGTNLGAVDTVLNMGASITFAEALKRTNPDRAVIATIGDSTFFHSGIPALVNARINRSAVVIVILDNMTTAMTGFQPVPHQGGDVTIEGVVRGCGIGFCEAADPDDIRNSIELLRRAHDQAQGTSIPSVVIFRKPCVTLTRARSEKRYIVRQDCTDCGICYRQFECPAIIRRADDVIPVIDEAACIGCGVCVSVCPTHRIEEVQ